MLHGVDIKFIDATQLYEQPLEATAVWTSSYFEKLISTASSSFTVLMAERIHECGCTISYPKTHPTVASSYTATSLTSGRRS